ncbi:MAG: zinc-binding alcohol dehydrogenase [Chloroflexi bacterium]|nr:zinc-binding alcohol dehydrogenase [Chloroflexota bacterium]
MKRYSLIFIAPHRIEIRQETLPAAKTGQVLVQTLASAISAGTEMLIYRGLAPADMAADTSIPALAGKLDFPLKYGYACVGKVVDTPDAALAPWRERLVFAFHPHESLFWAEPSQLHPLPQHTSPHTALFLPNMETAVNFVQDGRPLLGEDVAVWGQGVVGLLTTALLAQFPLATLTTFDRYSLRRKLSLSLGAGQALDPDDNNGIEQWRRRIPQGPDLVYELAGAPAALNQAINLTGYHSRVIIGSWYGRKRVTLDLGGAFHRNRVQLRSSQVSTIEPALRGRWPKARRLQSAWHQLGQLPVEQLITHHFAFTQAANAYTLLDQHPESALQIILDYTSI